MWLWNPSQSRMRIEKSFKSYLKNQLLKCWKEKWFNIEDVLYAIIFKSKCSWRMNNNYTKKLVIEKLNKITSVSKHHTWSSNINQLVIEYIIN